MKLRKTRDGRFLLEQVHPSGVQKFNPRAVQAGISAGTHSLSADAITLHTDNQGDVVFAITDKPGRTCLYCGEHFENDPAGNKIRAHIAAEHAGVKSPDASVPHGYKGQEYYTAQTTQAAEVNRG